MTDHNRIKILINDYVNEALPLELNEEIEGHVNECKECKSFLNKVKELLSITSSITPEIIPPKEIWNSIVADVKRTLPEEKEERVIVKENPVVKQKQEIKESPQDFLVKSNIPKKNKSREKRLFPKLILITMFVLLIVAAFYYFNNGKSGLPTGQVGWKLQTVKGAVRIGKSDVSVGNVLANGEKLVTGPGGSVQVEVPNFGLVSLAQNSVVNKTNKNEIQFLQGKIYINKNVGTSGLFSIVCLGTKTKTSNSFDSYNITNNIQTASLSVNSGLVEVTDNKFSAYVPTGFTCEINKRNGVGIPYSENASPHMIQALRNYTFGGQQYAVAQILSVAQKSDAVSLWNLLVRVNSMYKATIFNQLASYVPPPEGLSQNSSFSLSSLQMKNWLEKITTNQKVDQEK